MTKREKQAIGQQILAAFIECLTVLGHLHLARGAMQ